MLMMSLKTFSVVAHVLTVALATTTEGQKLPECFEEGECTESLYVADWRAEDAQTCLELCRVNLDCEYFTFYEDQEECTGFANCEVFSTLTCTNCYSGASTCEDLQCWVEGRCQGVLIDEVTAQASNSCMDLCKANETCLWFTYNSVDNTCFLLEDCQQLDPCNTCLSAQRQCSAQKGYTKIIVIGGYNSILGSDISTVEVIDLENPGKTCNLINDYPVESAGMAVGIIDGLIKSCGGVVDQSSCYDYNPETNSWITSASMLRGIFYPRASFIDGLWLVSGDGLSTEMWTGSGFEEGPKLPVGMTEHCQLTINSTHVFFADAYNTGVSYLLDWYEQTWTELPAMTVGRIDASCGLIYNPELGTEIVVVEDGVTEIFNLETLEWRMGPSLSSFDESGFAQLTDTFVVVGGENDDGDAIRTIYQFDHINYEWILKSQRLQTARETYPAVVAVPDEFVSCS